MNKDELIEVMARGTCALDNADPDEIMPDKLPRWRDRAAHCEAALAAIEAAGCVVVSLPTALREQACAMGKIGTNVVIDCETSDEAIEILDWLCDIPASPMDGGRG